MSTIRNRRSHGLKVIAAALVFASAGTTGADAAEAKFLVIVPEALRGELSTYLDHKRKQLSVECVTIETILADSSGVDDPEKLKRFLYEAWRTRGTRYVLLVGDADVLPVRYMVLDRVTPAAFDYAFYPSDLYYADVARSDGTFDDWNAMKEGFHAQYCGEVRGEKNKDDPINYDQIDYIPDLALGRWPVSTPEEVRLVAAKTIAYEEGTLREGAKSSRRAAFVVVDGWVDGRERMDRLSQSLPKGWSADRRFYKVEGEHATSTPPPTEAELVSLLNEGVGLMLHVGHGSDDSWAGCFSVNTFSKLTNAEHLPILLSAGCSTARFATLPPYEAYEDVNGAEHTGTDKGEVFDSPPPPPSPWPKGKYNKSGLGERLLRDGPTGAVAYIGCNTGGQPCGITLLEGFVKALGTLEEPRLGDCWKGAVAYYHRAENLATIKPTESWYPASIYFQGMKYMLFGDPTLAMPRAD